MELMCCFGQKSGIFLELAGPVEEVAVLGRMGPALAD